MTIDILESLASRHTETREELSTLVETARARVLEGGNGMSAEERTRSEELRGQLEEIRTQVEAERDLRRMETEVEALGDIEREVAEVSAAAQETGESNREVARALGSDALQQYDERSGAVLRDFEQMSREGKGSRLKLNVNPFASHNMRMLRDMGVSTRDYTAAVRGGHQMIAARDKDGNPDVRVYSMADASLGPVVPTYWDDMLYMFARYIGGVQTAGAEIIPVTGNNTLKLNVITRDVSGLTIATEGSNIETETTTGNALKHPEVALGVGNVELTPRPYRGYSGETDEITRSAVIETRLQIVLRGLSRSLQIGKEGDFHSGTGTGEPKGILNQIPASRTYSTADGETTREAPDYAAVPILLSMLDTEYHTGRPGSVGMMLHSAFWYKYFVGAMDGEGRGLYPQLMQGSGHFFVPNVHFSFLMEQALTDDSYPIVLGNFMDGYVIATMGGQEIEVTDDARFLQWETVYRIQEYCDGTIRDNRAFSYLRLTDA